MLLRYNFLFLQLRKFFFLDTPLLAGPAAGPDLRLAADAGVPRVHGRRRPAAHLPVPGGPPALPGVQRPHGGLPAVRTRPHELQEQDGGGAGREVAGAGLTWPVLSHPYRTIIRFSSILYCQKNPPIIHAKNISY